MYQPEFFGVAPLSLELIIIIYSDAVPANAARAQSQVRNQNYSQWVGREELFERERSSNPDWQSWNACVSACDALIGAYGEGA